MSKSPSDQLAARSRRSRHVARRSIHQIIEQHKQFSTGTDPSETGIVRLVDLPAESGIHADHGGLSSKKAPDPSALHSNHLIWKSTALWPTFDTEKATVPVTTPLFVKLLTTGVETRSQCLPRALGPPAAAHMKTTTKATIPVKPSQYFLLAHFMRMKAQLIFRRVLPPVGPGFLLLLRRPLRPLTSGTQGSLSSA